jgi:hypothetical protein
MFETLIFFGVLLLTQVTKKYIFPTFGSTGVHVLTFVIALIGVGMYQYATANPGFMAVLMESLQYLAGAVAVYEIILKKIGVKSVSSQIESDMR